MSTKNINELTLELAHLYDRIVTKKVDHNEATAACRAAKETINSVARKMEYNKMRGDNEIIPFLESSES